MKRIILLILLCMFVIGCETKTCNDPKFKYGEVVKSVIGDHTGQIVKIFRGANCICYYDVRFNIKSNKTKTHLINQDDDIETGLSLITWMNEFELKKIN